MEKRKTVFLVIGIVLAAVILAVGIYQIYLESRRTSAPPTAQAQAQAAVSATAAAAPDAAPETEPVSQPSWHTCPVCGGTGGTWEYTYNGYGMVVGSYFSPCPNCNGSGQILY